MSGPVGGLPNSSSQGAVSESSSGKVPKVKRIKPSILQSTGSNPALIPSQILIQKQVGKVNAAVGGPVEDASVPLQNGSTVIYKGNTQ